MSWSSSSRAGDNNISSGAGRSSICASDAGAIPSQLGAVAATLSDPCNTLLFQTTMQAQAAARASGTPKLKGYSQENIVMTSSCRADHVANDTAGGGHRCTSTQLWS
jgi:hypothetical protein